MTELTLYGRGGQGGVTLAKLIAAAYFLKNRYVQAFGVYAAERSGAPLQAFVRIDDEEITNHNQIREPDHVIVLDHTLIGESILTGLKPDGWIVLNAAESPAHFAALFAGRRLAAVNATAIAVEHGLGTRAVPIVNTTMLGAVARVLGLTWAETEAALTEFKFGGPNVSAARRAFDEVAMATLSAAPGVRATCDRAAAAAARGPAVDILDESVGALPRIRTGAWATRHPLRHNLTPPCNHGCPAGNDVRGFVQAVAAGNHAEALATLLATSPLPAVCGRVCPAPCMSACNRGAFDEPVNVPEIERDVGDRAARPPPAQPWRAQRVAVVGSGPAGLSAAYHLARLGYHAVLYESRDELGGVMRTGIPSYRLPRDVLDREIEYILRHGITAHTGVRIDRTELLQLSREFDAVFVATGLQELRSLNFPPGVDHAVVQGIDFLDHARLGRVRLGGQRVVVIGGGNTALDAARTARRLGARSVRIVYRRTRAEMPAIPGELDEALEEDIQFDELVAPLRLQRDVGHVLLTCMRMTLGAPGPDGRRQPVPLESEDAEFDLVCDLVILALGQSSDLSILPEGAEVRNGGELLGLTAGPVFVGGDFSTHDGTVSAAIGSGRKAALHIHRTLTGEDLFPPTATDVAGPEVVHMHMFNRAPRQRGLTVPAELRRHTFDEVHAGLLDEPARHPASIEAQRCFSCGVCNSCDRCLDYCPEGILLRDGDGYRFDYDYCKGCGVCATQCPRGVIFMSEL